MEKIAKSGDKEAKAEYEVLVQFKSTFKADRMRVHWKWIKEHSVLGEGLQLLTDKPIIYVANVDEESINSGNEWSNTLAGEYQK